MRIMKQTKTAFVLAHADFSGDEVVSLAKKEGMKLSTRYVYSVRSKARARVGQPKRKRGRPPKHAATSGMSGSVERRFLDLALDLGIGRAEALLRNVRALARA
jgi:hypothetical protein